ncbi:MAG: hypothetical protein AAFN92_07065 [Bacteroidota bacterium]
MRLLTLLATVVLLTACIHDTEELYPYPVEYGVSLVHYFGGTGKADEGSPWDYFEGVFPEGSFQKGKRGYNDPWDTIFDKFNSETIFPRKAASVADHWDTVMAGYEPRNTRSGALARGLRGCSLSEMSFVVVGDRNGKANDPWDKIFEIFSAKVDWSLVTLRLVEVRGVVGRFESPEGVAVFAIGVPGDWQPGMVLRAEAYLLEREELLPLMGALVWEVDRNLSDAKAY